MIPNMMRPNMTIERPAPIRSRRPSSGSRESGTKKNPNTIATAAMGTFTRNTDPHAKCSSSRPPPSGPITIPRPATPAQMPIARARSLPENVFVRIDSVVGKMNAPPIPMSPRATISISGEVERDASAENVPNMTRPVVSAFLRPKRSPSAPAVRSMPANTIVYESMIHCSCDPSAPRSRTIDGSATLRIVLSTLMTTSERQSTASVIQRR